MARVVSGEVTTKLRPKKIRIGKQMIEIITTGMYSDPRMILREYVQNAVDSIDVAEAEGILLSREGIILITLDGRNRTITIEDNGVGISNDQVEEVLCSLGCSPKEDTGLRGFRGVGRLGGLGYCDQVSFETRSGVRDKIAKVMWDSLKLKGLISHKNNRNDLAKNIQGSIEIDFHEAAPDDPKHFFRVTLINVHRFHKDVLMNVKNARKYLSQTVPVPYNDELFPIAREIREKLSVIDGFQTYTIFLNEKQLFRPYELKIDIGPKRQDEIKEIKWISFHDHNGALIGRGWVAITDFLASLPTRIEMRGIRVRQGNIAVGDEYFLSDYFSEKRFATWQIGEIHLKNSVKLNARRDGFEHTPDYERFIERVFAVCQYLSGLCRTYSKKRSVMINANLKLNKIEDIVSTDMFLDDSHYKRVTAEAKNAIFCLESDLKKNKCLEKFNGRLDKTKDEVTQLCNEAPLFLKDCLDGNRFKGKSGKKVLTEVCQAIAENSTKNLSPELLINTIVKPFLKPCCTNKKLTTTDL